MKNPINRQRTSGQLLEFGYVCSFGHGLLTFDGILRFAQNDFELIMLWPGVRFDHSLLTFDGILRFAQNDFELIILWPGVFLGLTILF